MRTVKQIVGNLDKMVAELENLQDLLRLSNSGKIEKATAIREKADAKTDKLEDQIADNVFEIAKAGTVAGKIKTLIS